MVNGALDRPVVTEDYRDRGSLLTPMGRLFIEPIEMLYAWAAKNDEALSKLRRRRKKRTASRDQARKTREYSTIGGTTG
jgi:DNA-binding HxlR family transcriptional regulator